MNEPYDPDDWQNEQPKILITGVKIFYYAIYCVIVYKIMRG